VSELFVNPGDTVLAADKLWGNYRLTFGVRQGGVLATFPLFDGQRFDRKGFRAALQKHAASERKVVLILNFPNNPTGFTPTRGDAEDIVLAVREAAEGGLRLVVVCDDAYFGLFYDDDALPESIFGMLAGVHPHVLAIKLDGATKEEFAWGFRVGFLTYAAAGGGDLDAVHQALEKKTVGAIRAGISNCPHPSQTIVLKALRDPAFIDEQQGKRELLRARAARVHEVLAAERFAEAWTPYPFNSGYFMCVQVHHVDAERLRLHLLDRYGVGVIANDATDIRIAFSCLEVEEIEEVFETIYRAWKDLAAERA
jgi:aspartate/methionine/tyrosine aminotransferase